MATGETVTVACKLPNGLHLDLVNNSGENVRVTLRGSAESRRADSAGEVFGDMDRVVGDYGLTRGVSKDFWDEWEAKYRAAKYPPLMSNLIFALAKPESAKARASEQREIRNGFEPIDPSKPVVSGQGKDAVKIETLERKD